MSERNVTEPACEAIDPQEILDHGYTIVRDAIRSDQLGAIRDSAELFLERARERSRGDRNIGWDTHRVPHPDLYGFVDSDTSALYEPLVSERILDCNRRLMRAESVCLTHASLFTEPGRKLEKRFQWHRDSVLRPSAPLPLRALQADHQANASGALTWNIALHDDRSLWVVPGSNRRANTAIEQEVLERPKMLSDEPLPGAQPCELRAGDGVAFDATMLHSGSNDRDKYRRTFNVSYRGFGGPVLAYNRTTNWKPDLLERLPKCIRPMFSRFEQMFEEERDSIANTLRAIIDRDESAFLALLARLHPGEQERMVCVLQLHRLAYALRALSARVPGADYLTTTLDHPSNSWRTAELLKRFSAEEVQVLWERFAALDRRLKRATDSAGGSTTEHPDYEQVETPQGFDVREFIASWEQQ